MARPLLRGFGVILRVGVQVLLPQFYFLLGMLFFANGLYLGFEFNVALYYTGIGLACSAYGLSLFIMRVINRTTAQKSALVSTDNQPADRPTR